MSLEDVFIPRSLMQQFSVEELTTCVSTEYSVVTVQDFANARHQWHGEDLSQEGIISEFESETLVGTSNHVVLRKLKALGVHNASDGLQRSFSDAAIGGIIFMQPQQKLPRQSSLSVPRFLSRPSSSQSDFETSISSYQPGLAESILTFDNMRSAGPPVELASSVTPVYPQCQTIMVVRNA